MIKYLRASISYSLVPTKTALAIEVTNCPNKCDGCHSPELRQDIGEELTPSELWRLIRENKISDLYAIDVVVFMGGDQHQELVKLLQTIRAKGLYTGLYTGSNDISIELLKELDYVKLGDYRKELGGLADADTNQALFKIERITKK